MEKKKIVEYIIISIVILSVAYLMISFFNFSYEYEEDVIAKDEVKNPIDNVSIAFPEDSTIIKREDGVFDFENDYEIYNFNVMLVDSNNSNARHLVTVMQTFDDGSIDPYNESYYILSESFEDDDGFTMHSMIVPIDSFDRENVEFTKNCSVIIVNGNDWDFVLNIVSGMVW